MITEVTRPVKPLVRVHRDLELARDTLRMCQRDLAQAIVSGDRDWERQCRADLQEMRATIDELSAEEDRVFQAAIARHDFRGLEIAR